MFDRVKPASLREQVVAQVRTAIIEGRLKPHDHIIEKDLTDQLGVSRTPVREALILLEREGLVVSYPNRGVFVRAFTPDDVAMIFSMRTTLENFAAERIINDLEQADFAHLRALIEQQGQSIEQDDFQSVRRTDMQFHQYLIEKAGHPLLLRTWNEIVAQIAAVLYIRAEAYPDYDEFQVVSDHTQIVAAYADRDLGAVRALNQRINARVSAECQQALLAETMT
jgi:DNA-binding GntR family transcriptional regulator